jgi:ABC-type Fe3+/spermidine/putrescine transport system ATPase subunit
LSALDPESRESLQDDLHQLHQNLKATFVHVTHDFREAATLADTIAVMGDGKVQQSGTPSQILREPDSVFVARFTMAKNIFRGEIQRAGDRHVFTSEEVKFETPEHPLEPCFAVIRPEDIRLSTEPILESGCNNLRGTIKSIVDNGATVSVSVDLPPQFSCLLSRGTSEELNPKLGQEMYVVFKADVVRLLDR